MNTLQPRLPTGRLVTPLWRHRGLRAHTQHGALYRTRLWRHHRPRGLFRACGSGHVPFRVPSTCPGRGRLVGPCRRVMNPCVTAEPAQVHHRGLGGSCHQKRTISPDPHSKVGLHVPCSHGPGTAPISRVLPPPWDKILWLDALHLWCSSFAELWSCTERSCFPTSLYCFH